MPRTVDTPEAARLLHEGALFVEVLPRAAYLEQHLPGAINLPLTEFTEGAIADLDSARTTVVYCFDYQCDLSSRAAARLERLGFTDVRDYVASKAAWMAAGLPVEGASDRERHAIDVARREVPMCPPDATVDDVRALVDGWPVCVVVDRDAVILGSVRSDALGVAGDTTVEKVMQPGPPTVRPSISTRELAHSMDEDGQRHVLVSTYDGALIGLVDREDLGGGR